MDSQVRIRKIWVNTQSEKDQVTVQFAQKIDHPSQLNKIALVAQALDSLGSGVTTALVSMKREVVEDLFGTTDADYSDQPFDQWPSAETLEAKTGKLAISVVENTTQNPNSPNQKPKINPSTDEVITYNGKPIYRHTSLTTVSDGVERVYLKSDTVTSNETSKVNALDAFGVNVTED